MILILVNTNHSGHDSLNLHVPFKRIASSLILLA